MAEIELDPELLADFIIESKELLEDYSVKVMELESTPDDPDVISAIFRAAHTLKGSSAFFNLTHIKNFAHKLENLLDDLRNKTRQITDDVIDILLAGGNHLKEMFARVNTGDYSTEMSEEERRFIQRLLDFMESEGAPPMTPEDALQAVKTMTSTYINSLENPDQIIRSIDELLNNLGMTDKAEPEKSSADKAGAQQLVYRFKDTDLTEQVTPAVTLMNDGVQAGHIDENQYEQKLIELLQASREQGLEEIVKPVEDALEDFQAVKMSDLDFDELILSMMKSKLDAVIDLLEVGPLAVEEPAKPEPRPETPTAEPEPQKPAASPKAAAGKERKTMRIDEEKVDGFMSYVGELIVTSETFSYLQKAIEGENINPATVRAFKNANQAFRELSDDLQESLMEIRRVSIKGLMQKINMMARELSHQMGKKVRVELFGQDVELDKSIAENLEGPLVHVVRNSLDHGLENPEKRVGTGKSEEGVLRVAAQADKEFFYLEVSDDGAGIDPDKMRKAGVEKGIISDVQASAMSDSEAVNLIFKAGFSTAAEITDVSGRGVGMDVVRTNLNRMNGSIHVESVIHEGTNITLKIPLSVTLQVVKALLIRVGADHFIISLDDIVESLRPAPGELATIEGRGEVINRRGQLFPLVRLYEVFDIPPQITDPTAGIMVVVNTSFGRYGFLVDEVLGQQQVVVKELDTRFKKLAFIAGSATLGDGRLGLVLDAEGVVKLAQGLS